MSTKPDFVEQTATRIAYTMQQGARVAWYTAQGLAMRRMIARMERDLPPPKRSFTPPSTPTPKLPELLRGVAKLMAEDMANVEAGLYPLPRDEKGGLAGVIKRSRRFFADAPKVQMRRRDDRHQEVYQEYGKNSELPRYYMQNFHFQTDGWMSRESAELYDTQVDVLFHGATAAMRRMGLAEIVKSVKGRDQRRLSLLDVATGPGTFLQDVVRVLPRLSITGLDLSQDYLDEARERLADYSKVAFIQGNAENMPVTTESKDLVSCIYLFHELPPKIRPIVALDIFRVLKPGGTFVFVDSLQTNDIPAYNGLLETFPNLFHEPYYNSYLSEDLVGMFERAGFILKECRPHFFSKVMCFQKH